MSIVVAGSANVDTVILGDRLPLPGETVEASEYCELPGGKGLNQAVAASRAGADVSFFFATGEDQAGDMLHRFLATESLRAAPVLSSQPTGRAFIQIDSAGENAIMIVGGSNTALPTWPDPLIVEAIGSASFLVLQQEVSPQLNRSLARHAQKAGTRVVLTPAPVEKTTARVVDLVDILILNEHEATQLGGGATPTDAARHLSEHREVILTRGKQGATFFRDGVEHSHSAAPRVTAIDTTGAGDCFAGFVVARLDAGDDIVDAIRTGCCAAGLSVTRSGAAPSIPTAQELDQWRKEDRACSEE